mmetsp:Transcript_6723/g.9598  ORF Transcript_6723/g.9598 Transcript_6723/m.9598 type:complete len:86 (-) Transcript_6723:210-467(-)
MHLRSLLLSRNLQANMMKTATTTATTTTTMATTITAATATGEGMPLPPTSSTAKTMGPCHDAQHSMSRCGDQEDVVPDSRCLDFT